MLKGFLLDLKLAHFKGQLEDLNCKDLVDVEPHLETVGMSPIEVRKVKRALRAAGVPLIEDGEWESWSASCTADFNEACSHARPMAVNDLPPS